jgi:hypothetical protein
MGAARSNLYVLGDVCDAFPPAGLRVNGDVRSEAASHKVLTLRNNIYSVGSVCLLTCSPSHPSDQSSTFF